MYVQLIQGHTSDPTGLRRQLEKWRQDLRADAPGFLGASEGIAEDGTVVAMARFASEQDAKANNDRPEQDAWWTETARCFDGEATFEETTDVDQWQWKNCDDARFVQVIQGRTSDPQELKRMFSEMGDEVAAARPDLLGTTVLSFGDRFCQFAYFTNEAEAREGEAAEMTGELADEAQRMDELMTDVSYIDLKDPILVS